MKGYRTLLFSLAVAIVGVLQAFDWASVVPAEQTGIVITAIGVASAVLRVFTDTAVGARE